MTHTKGPAPPGLDGPQLNPPGVARLLVRVSDFISEGRSSNNTHTYML